MKDTKKQPSLRLQYLDLNNKRMHVYFGRIPLEPEITEKIQGIVIKMIDDAPIDHQITLLGLPPLDLSAEAGHDSKSALNQEYDLLEKAEDGLRQTIDALAFDNFDLEELQSRLSLIVDVEEQDNVKRKKVETASDLIEANIAKIGFYKHTLKSMKKLQMRIKYRMTFLDDQREKFWSAPNRSPSPYPRTIALRLARTYANYWQKKPKANTVSKGNNATGLYSQSLEEIFELLTIDQNFLKPAKWAISKITQEDLEEYKKGSGGLFGLTRIQPA